MQLGSAFVHHFDIFLLCHNYAIYFFNVITFSDNVRIALYFGTFELRLEITLQFRYTFARHCDVILLRHTDVVLLRHSYLFLRCSYVF